MSVPIDFAIPETIADKKAQLGDVIVRKMLRQQGLPFDPQAIRVAGYELVIRNDGQKTTYRLCKVLDEHTIEISVTDAAFHIDVDKQYSLESKS